MQTATNIVSLAVGAEAEHNALGNGGNHGV